jgi:hypothetical protein
MSSRNSNRSLERREIMARIRAFGKVLVIRSPRKEASALRKLAALYFAAATDLDWDGECELAEFYRSTAGDYIDDADDAEQDKRRVFIRQDTWTSPVRNAVNP